MGALTGLLYACLAVYLGGWFFGYWVGDFSLLLFLLTVVTLGYWLAERFRFKPAREAAAERLAQEDKTRREMLAKQGITQIDGDVEVARQKLLMQPWWLDWTAGLFPVILVVFLLRSFLFEPFKIPSGSMIPTLHVGDLILVNKYHYGVRLPVINKLVVANHEPQRGDVIVFRYPLDPRIDYIKRVVAIPGDTVSYLDHQLTINGKPVPKDVLPDRYDDEMHLYVKQFMEDLGGLKHRIQQREQPEQVMPIADFPYADHCQYSAQGVVCKVPAGHFFAMGDNRDNSQDSRYWGFVPDENIVGKAFYIWMNFGNLSRIGGFH
jgi:signal peptidase I